MKRVIVIGCPGSGKSTFARALHHVTAIPLYHLDMMNWNRDKTTVSKDVFLDRLDNVLDMDTWIIDGNYSGTMAMRMAHCDTVFFLDYDTKTCLDGIVSRRNQVRSDMPWVETETDPEFIEFIKSYNEAVRPDVLSLLETHQDKDIFIFKERVQAERYLEEMTLFNREQFHLNKDNRNSGKFVEILHPVFKEFGQSGAIYHREDFMGIPLSDDSEYQIMDYELKKLSEDNYLATYVLLNKITGDRSNRSSVWIRFEGEWKLYFHQGTTVKN